MITQDVVETFLQQQREEGRREGRDEGRREGRDEGRDEGLGEAILLAYAADRLSVLLGDPASNIPEQPTRRALEFQHL